MGNDSSYTRRALELQAAEYYASIRKPENEWYSIIDLTPQLAEFAHRLRAQEYMAACQVLNQVEAALYSWGYYAQLAASHEQLLPALTVPDLRMYNIGGLGRTYQALGKIATALDCYQQALELALVISDHRSESVWRGELGCAYYDTGRFSVAGSLLQEALEIARRVKDRALEAHHLGNLGRVYGNAGQYEDAIQVYEQALQITSELGDSLNTGVYKGRLGVTYRRQGRLDRAIPLYQEALPLLHESGARAEYERHLGDLGSAYRDLGRFDLAIALHQKSLAVTREIGHRRDEGVWLSSLGLDYYSLGLVNRALALYRQVQDITREIGDQRNLSVCLCRLGDVYQLKGQREKAFGYYQQALLVATQVNYQPGLFECYVGLSRVALNVDKFPEAQQHCIQALRLRVSRTYYWATLLHGIVGLYQHNTNAAQSFAETLRLCRVALENVTGLYQPHYVLATALVGQAVCNLHWIDPAQRSVLLTPALAEYRRALDITAAPGIVRDALRDLELIRAASTEGLEPVFALLEEALNNNTPSTEDDPDLITV